MTNKRTITAVVLMVSMTATNILMPADAVRAGENTDAAVFARTEEEITDYAVSEEAAAVADGVELVDLPAEDGAYVVYMETDITADISLGDEVQEIADWASETIVETDLSASQARELEIRSSQSEEIYIEENIFLEGASSDTFASKPAEWEEDDADESASEPAEWEEDDADESAPEPAEWETGHFLEEMDAMERFHWKKAQIGQMLSGKGEDEWNVQMVRADEAAAEINGAPVKVAVLDSGVEFLAGIPVERSVNLVKDEQDLPYYMNDMTGHGTAVADIIHQVCPQARIYSVKVMDSRNRGRLSDIVAGIYWCIEQDVDIINMSFGTSTKSDILEKAIQAAADQGIMMVSSAGNGGTGSAVEYPAAYAEVIAVGAVDTAAQKTEESATGEAVELAAPGEQIAAKSLLGLETVNSGTSMAAPHVAGAAALLMQQSESKDAAFIRQVLQKSSNPLGDEAYYGSGLLDVAYAQEMLEDYEELVMADEPGGVEAESGTAVTEAAANEISPDHAEEKTTGDEGIGETENRSESLDESGQWETVTSGEAGIVEDGTLAGNAGAETGETEDSKEAAMDALEEVEQVSRPVETFEEIDYVEGRWGGGNETTGKDGHGPLAVRLGKEFGYNQTEISILKAGAVYPDRSESGIAGGNNYPEWHGSDRKNFVANYIFATRIAMAGGSTTNLKRENGQEKECYDRMKEKVSALGVGSRYWYDIFGNINNIINGNELDFYDIHRDINQIPTTKKHWRQLFLYGMALHTATDAFAHSCYAKLDEKTYQKFLHKDTTGYDKNYQADNMNHVHNRWLCAQDTAYAVMVSCLNKFEGFAEDFSSDGEAYWNEFYMLNLYFYACKTLNVGEKNYYEDIFKAVTDFSLVDLTKDVTPSKKVGYK